MRWPTGGADGRVEYVLASLVVAVFLPGMSTGVAYPTLPQLEPVLGISPLVVGVIVSATNATRLLCNAPVGSLFDRMGTRRPLVVGFLLMGVAPFAYALGTNPGSLPLSPSAVFLVSRGVNGLGAALTLVGCYATITAVTTTENRGRWLGYMIGSYGVGAPVGLLVGGVAADVYGLREAFLLSGVVGLVSVVIVVAILPDVSPEDTRDVGLRAVPGLVRADHRLAVVAMAGGAVRLLGAVFFATVVLLAGEHELAVGGLGESGVGGAVLALSAVCAAAANLAAGRYSDSLENRAVLILPSLFVLAGGFVLVATVPTLPGIAVGVAVAGIGGGAAGPALLAYLGDISPTEDVGKLGGVYNVFRDVGGILGPVVGLPLAATVGFGAGYLACAGIAVLAAILVGKTLLSAPTTVSPALTE